MAPSPIKQASTYFITSQQLAFVDGHTSKIDSNPMNGETIISDNTRSYSSRNDDVILTQLKSRLLAMHQSCLSLQFDQT